MVYASPEGLTHGDVPGNPRLAKVNLMTFTMRDGTAWSITYTTNTNQVIFEDNLRRFLTHLQANYGSSHVLLLMDNAPYHTERVLTRVRESHHLFNWVRLPVCSPDTNPSEFFFHM